MMSSVDTREEIRFLMALCDTYERSRLTVVRVFPPFGDPNRHRLDAIVLAADANGPRRVAVEFTKAFQGAKVGRGSPTQNEVEAWRRLEGKIRAAILGMAGIGDRCVECRILLQEEIRHIQRVFQAPRTRADRRAEHFIDWLVVALAAPLQEALALSLQTKRAEQVGLSPELTGIVAHAQVNAYADWGRFFPTWPPAQPGVYVEIKSLISVGNSKDATIVPRWIGIDSAGIIDSVRAKLEAVPAYRAVATECGADELWLVTVADGSSQMSMIASPFLPGVKERIRELHDRAAAKRRLSFERVIFLAAGYWAPADLRDLDAAGSADMTFRAFDLYGEAESSG